jgi:DNA-binding transcriptional LysR family regulator
MNELDSRQIEEINALLAVAEGKSFVGAGRLIQRDPSIISKRILALEKRLGVRLLERTTRQVRLTDVGAALVERLHGVHALIADAVQDASAGATQLRGKLRLACPGAMGRLWISHMLCEFVTLHPMLIVEVDYQERYVDLISEGVDAAIRVGKLEDNRLVAKKLSEHRRFLCASVSYIKRFGLPRMPRDLATHNCLGFTGLKSYPNWRLSRRGRSETIATNGSLISNDSETLLAAARAGVGILGAGDWLMSRDLASGTLVRILPDWTLDAEGGVYLVRPSAGLTPAKTKAFVDWISGKFASGPPWSIAAKP